MKYSKYIVLLTIILSLIGCANSNIDNLRDPDLATGCVVVEYKLGFNSYLKTTQGGIEACKVKCSKKLPENFYYEYENNRTGCHIVVSDVELINDDIDSLSEVRSLSDIKRLSDIGD